MHLTIRTVADDLLAFSNLRVLFVLLKDRRQPAGDQLLFLVTDTGVAVVVTSTCEVHDLFGQALQGLLILRNQLVQLLHQLVEPRLQFFRCVLGDLIRPLSHGFEAVGDLPIGAR